MPHVPSLIDVLFIFVLFLLFFGTGRLSGLGKGIGDGIRNFKKGLHADSPPPPPSNNPPSNNQPPNGRS